MRGFVVIILITFVSQAHSQSHPINEKLENQFDFWIGQWDVNLRVKQPDNTWEDKIKSEARIYSILGGKAILELWDESETGIIGYSFRYYNPSSEKWELWLNWPGLNRSGTNSLSGDFRHGRGEFFSTRPINDSTELISRYSFNDITPNSLRWDDAYSKDGGKTWTNNWIMEFSRKAQNAPEINQETKTHTYYSGKRCSTEAFNVLKELAGIYKGDQNLELYSYIDGCALMGFIDEFAFFTLTYNTYINMYELCYYDVDGDGLQAYYGNLDSNTLKLGSRNQKVATVSWDKKFTIELQYEDFQRNWSFKKK